MEAADLGGVKALSDVIHPGLAERIEVFADRLAVFPAGCLVLSEGGGVCGYAISHPARLFAPPPLDHLLGRMPEAADGYYIHDVAVASRLRGQGLAAEGVDAVLRIAHSYRATALISVYGTAGFWSRFGFIDETAAMPPAKLEAYGADARYMVRRHGIGGSADAMRRD